MLSFCRRASILPLALAAGTLPLLSQQAVRPVPGRTVRVTSAPSTGTAQSSLPIRRVSLYKNGVGFFEHIGTVRGNQAVTIDFTTAQLNDVLQSLTAVDLGGGRIGGAGYNSTTPLDQQLKSLPISLSADPTAADFYTAIRGARVEVTGSGAPITGRILNVELRETTAPKKEGDDAALAQRHFLTVVSDSGTMRTLELTGSTSVHLLDGNLHTDVNRYLEILAGNHQDGLRHLTLTDNGPAAARELRVSYISEVPIWKCTYRLLFDNRAAAGTTKTATLQGWAVIDNTVGSDWNNVELSLIAGAPQSFLQPISQPYYSRRPEIGLPQEAQLTPQTHESGEQVDRSTVTAHGQQVASAGAITGSLGLNTSQQIVGQGVGRGVGNGYGQGSGGGTYRHGMEGRPEPKRDRLSNLAEPLAAPSPIAYEDSVAASITPNTKTGSFDDYFEYKLTEPVTIRKNESALVPILQAKVDVDPVTLWSPSQPQPLRALWLKNTSQLTLDRGSFSILENGNFSGQGLLDPIHPGERRLLSYAADQAVRVSTEPIVDSNGGTRKVQQITIAKGILTEKIAETAQESYSIHNAASDPRTVVVEQPRRGGWELSSDAKPEETTPSLYRFRVSAAPGATEHLRITERHTISTRYALASAGEEQLTLLLRQDGDPAEVVKALQPILETKRRLADLDAQIGQHNQEIGTIQNDQNRLRENLKALKGSAEERALTKRYTDELNSQEDRLKLLRDQITGLQQQQQSSRDTLAGQLEALNLEAAI